MPNVNDFLASLNTLAEKNSIDVYLPTLQRSVKFKSVTAKQHKSLYTCVRDNVIYNTKFFILTHDIIKDNCLEPDVIKQLTIIDRVFVLLALRKGILGTTIKQKNADFSNCIQAATSVTLPVNEAFVNSGVKIEVQVPTLEDAYNMEKELRGNLEPKTLTVDMLTQEVILNSLCKYIKNIWIVGESEDTDLNFSSFSYKDRITLIEQLPATVLTSMQSFAGKVTSIQDNATKALANDNTEVQFFINADFFLSE
jgi:hypothetical protein